MDEVIAYVGELSERYFAAHTNMFRHHEIDGKALLLLTTDVLVKYMGFKLGPALKLNNYLDKLRSANNVVLNSKPPSMASSASSSNTSLPPPPLKWSNYLFSFIFTYIYGDLYIELLK